MMLTVSMMSAIFIKTWKTLEVSEALNRLLKVLIIAINAQSHSVYAPLPPRFGGGDHLCPSSSAVWILWNFTRYTRIVSTNGHHKSAITDHVCQNNHIMNWEASQIVEQESDNFKRWIKESIYIRSNTPTMNRDEGAYQLPPIWTQVFSTPKTGEGGGGGRASTE